MNQICSLACFKAKPCLEWRYVSLSIYGTPFFSLPPKNSILPDSDYPKLVLEQFLKMIIKYIAEVISYCIASNISSVLDIKSAEHVRV